jgi:hypothetical protein
MVKILTLKSSGAVCYCAKCSCYLEFHRSDLKHYRHDVEGNNVYVECTSCNQPVSCYKQAVEAGWVEPDQL